MTWRPALGLRLAVTGHGATWSEKCKGRRRALGTALRTPGALSPNSAEGAHNLLALRFSILASSSSH